VNSCESAFIGGYNCRSSYLVSPALRRGRARIALARGGLAAYNPGMRQIVYVETSVVSYLTGRKSQDIIVAELMED
jgi:hypothetical protein